MEERYVSLLNNQPSRYRDSIKSQVLFTLYFKVNCSSIKYFTYFIKKWEREMCQRDNTARKPAPGGSLPFAS